VAAGCFASTVADAFMIWRFLLPARVVRGGASRVFGRVRAV